MDVATVNAYFTADRSRVVGEGDPDAAYLLVNAGSSLDGLSEADRKAYDNFAAGKVDNVEDYDAVADHAARHGTETATEAGTEADVNPSGVEGVADLDEDGNVKSTAPRSNKARGKAPADKGE